MVVGLAHLVLADLVESFLYFGDFALLGRLAVLKFVDGRFEGGVQSATRLFQLPKNSALACRA